jgi:DNA-binding NarL/FixJ family response regulator
MNMTAKLTAQSLSAKGRQARSAPAVGSARRIRILVVDDHNVVRDGLVQIIALQNDMQVVGEAADGIEAVELTRQSKPDVVLLDMVMPRQDGLATIPQLLAISPNIKILVLTSF